MDTAIPSLDEVRAKLRPLTYSQVQELSRVSGVAFTTLWKFKTGETVDPGFSKVRAIWPFLGKFEKASGEPVPIAPRSEAPTAADIYVRGDGTVTPDTRDPDNASRFIAPKRRASDRPRG